MRSGEAHFGHHSSATMAKIAEDRACAELASALHKWLFAAQIDHRAIHEHQKFTSQ
ncbi:MAG: hypothetical protein R2828_01285 [Saprospiraceae bacterium]